MKLIINLLIIATFALLLSCKEKEGGAVAIYPLSPHKSYISDKGGKGIDSMAAWLSFIVYNIPDEKISDSAYLKPILKPFADSVFLHSKMRYIQFEFYKQSAKLDTTYRKEQYNPLYEHQEDWIANYFKSSSVSGKNYWVFINDVNNLKI